MRRARRVGRPAVILLLVAFGVLGPAAPAAADGFQPVDLAAVDRLVSDELAASSIPGAAIAITRGTQVVHVRGYGHDADDVPITENSRFRIASLSKSFTSLAVLQLVDAGRVSLDDPVVAHLPEFRLADPRGGDITVRQLLDQTSGLADRAVPELSRRQPTTLAEATTSLGAARFVAAPGTQFNYHNPNYQVAARLVEVLSGQPFDMARWLVVQANGGRTAAGTRLVSERSMTDMHTPSAPGGYALGWDTFGPTDAPTRLEHSGNLLTFSAYQAVLPQSGYGVAVLFNSGSALLLEQTAIFRGVLQLVDGTERGPGRPRVTTAALDTLLGCLTVLVLALGARSGLASRRWATRHPRSRVYIVLGLVPSMAVLGLVVAFPDIAALLMGGRDVSWIAAAYGWPALVVLVAAALIAAATTLIARCWQLSQVVRNPAIVPVRTGRKAPRVKVSKSKNSYEE